jgi:hypothetical protein
MTFPIPRELGELLIDRQYGENGLNQKELVAEYIMSITTEAVTLLFLLRAVWLVTMPKHLFVPYDKRNQPTTTTADDENELGETATKSRQAHEV